MTSFSPLPLGTRIPNTLHAVSCSLPTMRDVVRYEEKDPGTLRHIVSGYPRFVVHELLVTVAENLRRQCAIDSGTIWATTSQRMAEGLVTYLAPGTARVVEHDGVWGVAHAEQAETWKRARAYLQHSGGLLSSRAAEDYAARHDLIPTVQSEAVFAGDAAGRIRREVSRILGLDGVENVLLAPSGMNAFWATFRAIEKQMRPRGRDRWLQVGWLYLDTGAILQKFTDKCCTRVFDVNDDDAIERVFAEHGTRLAGVITEVTTNPLMQTTDLPRLAELARSHGALMIVDPSVVSPHNVDVRPHADIILNSLTKYAACEGDVIAGAVALTAECPERAAWREAIAAELEPMHPRDAARLAHEIESYDALVEQLNANTRAVVEHLKSRRGVRRLLWSEQAEHQDNYLKLARRPDRIGPMLSFEIDGPVAGFFDATPLPKGPSFGMKTSLLCPFVHLAHYDLITSPNGRAELTAAGLDPELLRFAVGAEPVAEIIEALEIGFHAAGFA